MTQISAGNYHLFEPTSSFDILSWLQNANSAEGTSSISGNKVSIPKNVICETPIWISGFEDEWGGKFN